MVATQWLDDEEQRAWRALVSVHARLMARLDAELQRAHDMTLPDYEVLVHLSEVPDASMRMAVLAELLLLSPGGLTRRLDGLVRDGLVERRTCPSDRRGSLAALTPRGRARLEAAAPTHVNGVRAYVVDQLSRNELITMTNATRRIGEALDTAPGPAIGSRPCRESQADLVDRPPQRMSK